MLSPMRKALVIGFLARRPYRYGSSGAKRLVIQELSRPQVLRGEGLLRSAMWKATTGWQTFVSRAFLPRGLWWNVTRVLLLFIGTSVMPTIGLFAWQQKALAPHF